MADWHDNDMYASLKKIACITSSLLTEKWLVLWYCVAA